MIGVARPLAALGFATGWTILPHDEVVRFFVSWRFAMGINAKPDGVRATGAI